MKDRKFGIAVILWIGLVLAAGMLNAAESALPAQAGKAKEAAPMAMFSIGTDTYTVADYASFLQRNPTIVSLAMNTDEGKVNAVKEMIAGHILRDQLFKDGLLQKKEDLSQKEVMAAYEELAKRHFPIPATPSEEKAYQYYQEHPINYGIPRMLRLSQILLRVNKGADERVKASVKAKAEVALARLNKGESFAKVATEITENPIAKVAGGDIGFVYPRDQPWLQMAIGDKKVGEESGVLESPEGYEILKITDAREPLVTPYANVRDKVIQEMKDEEQKVLRNAYVKELAKGIKIEILEPTLKLLMPNGAF